MGAVSSKPEDGSSLYLTDQTRFTISSLSISNPRKRSTITISPNAFPATRLYASRPLGENTPIEFVQDPEASASGLPPSFLLKLNNDDELNFTFTFIIRQPQQGPQPGSSTGSSSEGGSAVVADTNINNLTYVYASTAREVENLVTREFHADPNLHKNANVALVGDYSTGGSPSVSFEWSWRWKPPKPFEDKGGGWRNSCSFVEYNPKTDKLQTLASFSYWISNQAPPISQPSSPLPNFLLASPPKIRVASAQSVDSRLSSVDHEEPASPITELAPMTSNSSASPPATLTTATPSATPSSAAPLPSIKELVRVDVACPKPGDDVTVADDGPVFRATIKALEQKTGNFRAQMKRVLKKAEHAHLAQLEANDTFSSFIDALKDASSTNANAVQPAIEHYFDKIAREIVLYERQNTANLQKIIIEPLSKLYTYDIKQAESKRRDFEEESKDYYAYVSRYLGQRQDSVKAKKLAQSDSKYQSKRRNFELKRFDYSSFMQDLHGGRKEQEVLSHLTKFADAQTQGFLNAARKIDSLLPQLEALSSEVLEADKEYQYQRREREEKRRLLEKSNPPFVDPEPAAFNSAAAQPGTVKPGTANGQTYHSDSEMGRSDSTASQLRSTNSSGSNPATASAAELSRSPGSLGHTAMGSPAQPSKFKGIRDLEEKDYGQTVNNGTQRKEGLLWALSRPGGHVVDPRAQLKTGWHKFWIVLDQGKLSEYSNWKQKLDLHMEPIDLRMASVREARNADRRFCFEVITPQFKRVYQATSEDDMNSWIVSINNALQSAVEGRGMKTKPSSPGASKSGSISRDIGSILTGKSPSLGHGHTHGSHQAITGPGFPTRRVSVGARPSISRSSSATLEENPDKLLQALRDNDQGNCWCADCGSGSKVEWVSINLAIILCIECSGIHRSLGTHISKVRSLTLDITSFTPDIIELLMMVGNRVANMVWEARLDPASKLTPQSSREQRLKFITAKYVDRAYIEPISPTLSRYASPDETLLAAIKKNEMQQVIYGLALKANPNLTDKSRGTHAVFLALAAADPAAPSPNPTQGMATAAATSTELRSITFPIAEILLQNGAEIPPGLPAFPLGRAAMQYIEQRRGRSTALPGDSVSSLNSTISAAERAQKEREARLQKRVSAGGRLAKSPIPER